MTVGSEQEGQALPPLSNVLVQTLYKGSPGEGAASTWGVQSNEEDSQQVACLQYNIGKSCALSPPLW